MSVFICPWSLISLKSPSVVIVKSDGACDCHFVTFYVFHVSENWLKMWCANISIMITLDVKLAAGLDLNWRNYRGYFGQGNLQKLDCNAGSHRCDVSASSLQQYIHVGGCNCPEIQCSGRYSKYKSLSGSFHGYMKKWHFWVWLLVCWALTRPAWALFNMNNMNF